VKRVRRVAAGLVVLASLAVAAPALGLTRLVGIRFVPASARNYDHHPRRSSAIREIVVHTVEGTYGGAIAWFRNPRARSSAHFVVSRDGDVVQMVPESRIAWHAGNGWANDHSLGIEHEGYTGVAGIYTDTEYRASAQLVAQLAGRYAIPLDRRHLIGHSEVPDPRHRGQFGGISHHTDPGHTWDWTRWLGYVRSYARGVEPPPLAFDVEIDSPGFAETLAGTVDLEAASLGEPAVQLDFLVDGKRRSRVTAEPFSFAWDTTAETNGRHVLTVHGVAADGRTADAAIVVKVANAARPPQVVGQSLFEGQTVSGQVPWTVETTGPVDHVEYSVDGVFRDAEFDVPYTFLWDSTQETPGPHVLAVRAVTPSGRPGPTLRVNVVVAPPEPVPPPEPAPQPEPAPLPQPTP
jgi:hypothetical protein